MSKKRKKYPRFARLKYIQEGKVKLCTRTIISHSFRIAVIVMRSSCLRFGVFGHATSPGGSPQVILGVEDENDFDPENFTIFELIDFEGWEVFASETRKKTLHLVLIKKNEYTTHTNS